MCVRLQSVGLYVLNPNPSDYKPAGLPARTAAHCRLLWQCFSSLTPPFHIGQIPACTCLLHPPGLCGATRWGHVSSIAAVPPMVKYIQFRQFGVANLAAANSPKCEYFLVLRMNQRMVRLVTACTFPPFEVVTGTAIPACTRLPWHGRALLAHFIIKNMRPCSSYQAFKLMKSGRMNSCTCKKLYGNILWTTECCSCHSSTPPETCIEFAPKFTFL